MPTETFRVEVGPEACADLYEIEAYWTAQDEAWRGQKYFRDLSSTAQRDLSDPARARRGRLTRGPGSRGARELLAFGIYRIIYDIDEAAGIVNVLRFWHAHRDNPPLV